MKWGVRVNFTYDGAGNRLSKTVNGTATKNTQRTNFDLVKFILLDDIVSMVIWYNVPLYDQGNTGLCFAFSQLMVKDFWEGVERTSDEALREAECVDSWTWSILYAANHITDIEDIDDLHSVLLFEGPIYAGYYDADKDGGHVVVVIGVNREKGLVYTNDPMNVRGVQTFEEFLQAYASFPEDPSRANIYLDYYTRVRY